MSSTIGSDVRRAVPGRAGRRTRLGSTASRGYLHCGPPGAGHFVKMIHNAIEYGLMAAYAEGFNVLKHANAGKQLRRSRRRNHARFATPSTTTTTSTSAPIAEVWRHGSVISSWLLDLTAGAFAQKRFARWLCRPRL